MAVFVGLLACVVSVFFFGSMFVPIKKFNGGDGIFVQWMMSIGILIVGFLVFCFKGFPGFYPLAMLGGAIWALGNITSIPIINRMGMALGMLIWNTTNCLVGWAGGRFGLFGMKANVPSSQLLNYLGLIFVVVGGVIFSQVRSSPSEEEGEAEEEPKKMPYPDTSKNSKLRDAESVVSIPDKNHGRLIGTILALVAGAFYGSTFVPVIYMQDNPDKFPGYPQDGLSYVFSHFFGIFLAATVIFMVYAIVKKNRPVINSHIAFPSIIGGGLWAIAQSSFFVANDSLSQAVTFPIITTLPGVVISLWSIIYFREIEGKRNFMILSVAMVILICGALLVGLSRVLTV